MHFWAQLTAFFRKQVARKHSQWYRAQTCFIYTQQIRSTCLTSSVMMTNNSLQASLEVWKLLRNEMPENFYFRDSPYSHCFFLLNSPTSVQRRILSHSQSLLNLYICFFLSSWILLLPQFSLTAWSNIFLKKPKKVFPLMISQYKWRKTDRTTVFCCQKALLEQLSNLAGQLQIFKCMEPVCLHSPALFHTVNKVTTFKNIPRLKNIFH